MVYRIFILSMNLCSYYERGEMNVVFDFGILFFLIKWYEKFFNVINGFFVGFF